MPVSLNTLTGRHARASRLAHRLRAILPAGAALDVHEIGDHHHALHPVERQAVARAVPQRVREFSTGRRCARAALSALGLPHRAIPVGANREPVWAKGYVGTISHSREICLAVAARTDDVPALGADLDSIEPLSPELRGLICTVEELRAAPAWSGGGIDPYKVIFSAKEALYKALYPHARRFIDFLEVGIRLDVAVGRWRVASLPADLRGWAAMPVEGRFLVVDRDLVTLAWATRVPRAEPLPRLPLGFHLPDNQEVFE
ncbi:MAG TPA: 4'-phosphopantetheinyl transferase superfamily protein [Longimicrobium sp.]